MIESSIGKKGIHVQSDILLVDEDLAWHHSSAAIHYGVVVLTFSFLQRCTQNNTCYLPLANYQIRFLVNNTRQTETFLCHTFLTAIICLSYNVNKFTNQTCLQR